jgi:hypothetical protein
LWKNFRVRVIELEADLFGLELSQRTGFDVKEGIYWCERKADNESNFDILLKYLLKSPKLYIKISVYERCDQYLEKLNYFYFSLC